MAFGPYMRSYSSFGASMMSLFRALLGEFEYDELERGALKVVDRMALIPASSHTEHNAMAKSSLFAVATLADSFPLPAAWSALIDD
eukprot:SAG11_NODE_731_length_7473_cov_5.500949_4_plen_86_part_00